jgi:hypothetical protein
MCNHNYIQVDSIWSKCLNCGLIIPANQTLFSKMTKEQEQEKMRTFKHSATFKGIR